VPEELLKLAERVRVVIRDPEGNVYPVD
jgi:hypothetical protein